MAGIERIGREEDAPFCRSRLAWMTCPLTMGPSAASLINGCALSASACSTSAFATSGVTVSSSVPPAFDTASSSTMVAGTADCRAAGIV